MVFENTVSFISFFFNYWGIYWINGIRCLTDPLSLYHNPHKLTVKIHTTTIEVIFAINQLNKRPIKKYIFFIKQSELLKKKVL